MHAMKRQINGARFGRTIDLGWLGYLDGRLVKFDKGRRGHYRWFARDWWSKALLARGRTLTECAARLESPREG